MKFNWEKIGLFVGGVFSEQKDLKFSQAVMPKRFMRTQQLQSSAKRFA